MRCLFVGLGEERSLSKKADNETKSSLTFWVLLSAKRNVKNNSDEYQATLAHEFQSSLRLTVGFSNIYYAM